MLPVDGGAHGVTYGRERARGIVVHSEREMLMTLAAFIEIGAGQNGGRGRVRTCDRSGVRSADDIG